MSEHKLFLSLFALLFARINPPPLFENAFKIKSMVYLATHHISINPAHLQKVVGDQIRTSP